MVAEPEARADSESTSTVVSAPASTEATGVFSRSAGRASEVGTDCEAGVEADIDCIGVEGTRTGSEVGAGAGAATKGGAGAAAG